MAIGIHVAHVGFFPTRNGAVVNKNDRNTSISDTLQTEHKHLVIPDDAIPNSAGYPTVDAYLKAEAVTNYVLFHMDQTTIVTYNQSQVNSV